MCGIAGYFSLEDNIAITENSLLNLGNNCLSHLKNRGPESSEVKLVASNGIMCHSRLRVSDDSASNDQPLISDASTIVYNGECYNLDQINKWLGKHSSADSNDTRTVQVLLELFGVHGLSQIEGMFALSWFDHKNKRLLIARDRYGQKPLFFYWKNGVFAFASSILALLELLANQSLKLNIKASYAYLCLRYFPEPETAIDGIYKLEPGQFGLLDLSSKDFALKRFSYIGHRGCMPDNSKLKVKRDWRIGDIRSTINDSVRRCLTDRSAVIISGGVDSGVVAAEVGQIDLKADKKFRRKAYTLRLSHQPKEEVLAAKKIAETYDWDHQVIEVDDRSLVTSFLRSVPKLGEPVGDRSLLTSLLLYQIIAPHAKVVIGGDGGDEFFCGYSRHRSIENILSKENWSNWVAIYLSHCLPVCSKKLWKIILNSNNGSSLKSFVKKFSQLAFIYRDNPMEFLRQFDIATYLSMCVIPKVDAASMDWGLEVRSPLLDAKLTNMALSLDCDVHFDKNGTGKKFLRESFSSRLGWDIGGKKKQGFGANTTSDILNQFLLTELKQDIHYLSQKYSNSSEFLSFTQLINHELQDGAHPNFIFASTVLMTWFKQVSDKGVLFP